MEEIDLDAVTQLNDELAATVLFASLVVAMTSKHEINDDDTVIILSLQLRD